MSGLLPNTSNNPQTIASSQYIPGINKRKDNGMPAIYNRIMTEDAKSNNIGGKGQQNPVPADQYSKEEANSQAKLSQTSSKSSLLNINGPGNNYLKRFKADNGLIPNMQKQQIFSSLPASVNVSVFDNLSTRGNDAGDNLCILRTLILPQHYYNKNVLFTKDCNILCDLHPGQILFQEPGLKDQGEVRFSHVRSLTTLNYVMKRDLTMSYGDWKKLSNGGYPLYPKTEIGDVAPGNKHNKTLYTHDRWTIGGFTRDHYVGKGLINVIDDGTFQEFPNIFVDCHKKPLNGSKLYLVYVLRFEDEHEAKKQRDKEFYGVARDPKNPNSKSRDYHYEINDSARVYPRLEPFVVHNNMKYIPQHYYMTQHVKGDIFPLGVVQYETKAEHIQSYAVHTNTALYTGKVNDQAKTLEAFTKLPKMGIDVKIYHQPYFGVKKVYLR